jgi:soluble lytic murein transglycosylase-like protein
VNPGVDIDAVIDALATRHGVSPRLVRAVIEAESGWNPRAVSRKGAAGLMQLMPGTARGHGVTDPFDPEQNLDAGVAELGAHLRQYEGELSLALAAYNAGGRSVARYGGIPPYRETLCYVRQVLDRYFTAGDLPRLGDGAR